MDPWMALRETKSPTPREILQPWREYERPRTSIPDRWSFSVTKTLGLRIATESVWKFIDRITVFQQSKRFIINSAFFLPLIVLEWKMELCVCF